MAERTQIRRGVGLAAAAALSFGVTVPLLKKASAGTGVFAAGSLLYLGAAAAAGVVVAVRRRSGPGAPLRAGVVARLIGVALLGAVCAPALLVAGVQRTDAVTMSLLLTLEAPFTMLLARLLFHEHLGRRALAAAALVLAGAMLVAVPSGAVGPARAGAAFVAAAMLAWACDNALSRTLADRDPLSVVAWKGLLGGVLSAAVAVVAGEARPSPGAAFALAGIGAVGYGLSLLCYLRAQALVGAARTASVFAAAPFVGSAVALVLGAPWPGVAFARGGVADGRRRVAARLGAASATAIATSRRATSTFTPTTTVTTRITTTRCPRARTATRTRTKASPTSTNTAKTCTTGTTTTDARHAGQRPNSGSSSRSDFTTRSGEPHSASSCGASSSRLDQHRPAARVASRHHVVLVVADRQRVRRIDAHRPAQRQRARGRWFGWPVLARVDGVKLEREHARERLDDLVHVAGQDRDRDLPIAQVAEQVRAAVGQRRRARSPRVRGAA